MPRIAYGTIVHNIKDISRSYNEAKMALDVGKIFYDEKSVIAYNKLGIGRSDLSTADSVVQDVY